MVPRHPLLLGRHLQEKEKNAQQKRRGPNGAQLRRLSNRKQETAHRSVSDTQRREGQCRGWGRGRGGRGAACMSGSYLWLCSIALATLLSPCLSTGDEGLLCRQPCWWWQKALYCVHQRSNVRHANSCVPTAMLSKCTWCAYHGILDLSFGLSTYDEYNV